MVLWASILYGLSGFGSEESGIRISLSFAFDIINEPFKTQKEGNSLQAQLETQLERRIL